MFVSSILGCICSKLILDTVLADDIAVIVNVIFIVRISPTSLLLRSVAHLHPSLLRDRSETQLCLPPLPFLVCQAQMSWHLTVSVCVSPFNTCRASVFPVHKSSTPANGLSVHL